MQARQSENDKKHGTTLLEVNQDTPHGQVSRAEAHTNTPNHIRNRTLGLGRRSSERVRQSNRRVHENNPRLHAECASSIDERLHGNPTRKIDGREEKHPPFSKIKKVPNSVLLILQSWRKTELFREMIY